MFTFILLSAAVLVIGVSVVAIVGGAAVRSKHHSEASSGDDANWGAEPSLASTQQIIYRDERGEIFYTEFKPLLTHTARRLSPPTGAIRTGAGTVNSNQATA